MAIKWGNVKIGTTLITNEIVFGKLNKKGDLWIEKSEDKTNEVIKAVIEHMMKKIGSEKPNYAVECIDGKTYILKLEIKE